MPSRVAKRATSDFKGDLPNPMMYGAKADLQQVFDGAMSSGDNILNCSMSAPFAPDHKDGLGGIVTEVGKLIWVDGVGSDGPGSWISGRIIEYISPTQVRLSVSADTTVSLVGTSPATSPITQLGAWVVWGTDDTAACQAFIDSTPPGRVYDFLGRNYLVSKLSVPSKFTGYNGNFYSKPSGTQYLSPIDIDGTVSPKSNILLQDFYINGLRHFQTGMASQGAENGGRHGIRVRGSVSDLKIVRPLIEYCGSDGIELFSDSSRNTSSDADATLCFNRVRIEHAVLRYNRRHGGSSDSLLHSSLIEVECYGNGTDVGPTGGIYSTLGTNEGDLGDRSPEIYPSGGFIPPGTTGSASPGYQYGLGWDAEGYGVGSCHHDFTLRDCRMYGNASYGVTFFNPASVTAPGFLPWRDLKITGGYYDPGQTLHGNQVAIVFYGGFSTSARNTTFSGGSAGATSIVLASATGLVAGQKIQLSQSTNNEIVIVGAGYTSGTTVPIVYPLRNSYTAGAAAQYFDQSLVTQFRGVTIDQVSASAIQLDGMTGVTVNHPTMSQWGSSPTWITGFGIRDFSIHGPVLNPQNMIAYLLDCDHDVSDFTQQLGGSNIYAGIAPTAVVKVMEGPIWGNYGQAIDSTPTRPALSVGKLSSTTQTRDFMIAALELLGEGKPACFSIGQGKGAVETFMDFHTGYNKSSGTSGARIYRGAGTILSAGAVPGSTSISVVNADGLLPGAAIILSNAGSSEVVIVSGAYASGLSVPLTTATINDYPTGAAVIYDARFDLMMSLNDKIQIDGHPLIFDNDHLVGYFYGTADPNSGSGVTMNGVLYPNTDIGIGSVYARGYPGSGAPPTLYSKTAVGTGTGWQPVMIGSLTIADQEIAYANGANSLTGDSTLKYDYTNNRLKLIGPGTSTPEVQVGKSGGSNVKSLFRHMSGTNEVASTMVDPNGNGDYIWRLKVNGYERIRAQAGTSTTQLDFTCPDGTGIVRLEVDDTSGGSLGDVLFGSSTNNVIKLMMNYIEIVRLTNADDPGGIGIGGVYRFEIRQKLCFPSLASVDPAPLFISAAQGIVNAGPLNITDRRYIATGTMADGDYAQAHSAAGNSAIRGRSVAQVADDIAAALIANTANFLGPLITAILADSNFLTALDGRYAQLGSTTSGPSIGLSHTHTI